jgi:hypothetical protein
MKKIQKSYSYGVNLFINMFKRIKDNKYYISNYITCSLSFKMYARESILTSR